MEKHTPGPWVYEWGAVYHEKKGRLIFADRDNYNTSPTERDANLRLCAAAPDLLAAAEAALAFLELLGYHGGGNTPPAVLMRAIARAKGD